MELTGKQARLLKMMEEIDNHAIILLDNLGNIESWNKGASQIKGYQAEEIIGKNFQIFYPDTDRESGLPARLLAEAQANGRAYHEGWRLRKDKTAFWGAVTIKALFGEQGELIGFGKITRDLTERIQAETTIRTHARNLEMHNKELEQFVYIASHDLQEPLLNVSNFVELIQTEHPGQLDDTAGLYLDIIQQSAQRMRSLIKGLLDYSRIGKEKDLSRVNCQEIVDTVRVDLSARLRQTGATLTYANLPEIWAYPIELRQLFQNLISNAIKFSKPNTPPVVSITAEKRGRYWKFSVTDNGIGIDPIHQKKIFLIFQRLHDRDAYEGNGIGLAHCKKIVEMHGGQLTVRSKPGEGSTFTFVIPVAVLPED